MTAMRTTVEAWREEELDALPIFGSFARVWKRCLDLVLGVGLAPLALAVTALAGLWIKLTEGGPIIYPRRVVGPEGNFDAYKIRTMMVDADEYLRKHPHLREEFEKKFKLPDDPRVTPLGRFLRRYSLDEFPQVWNVLRGQMTMVGPRMITEPELAYYGKYAPLIRRLKPGLSGYWQVNGRQRTSYDERVEMDFYYITHWSPWLDLRILAKTVFKVLAAEGAY